MTKPRASRRLATVAVLLALVVAAFESTVVTVAMPMITLDLGGRDAYAWVFSAFLLASMVGILACGKLADAHGRRPVFIVGMGIFLVGSMLSGLAPNIASLIGFRVVQGLGAGAIQPIAMTISADLYTLRERARVQALFTTAWGGASALGPLIGGFIVDNFSWRWVFLVNVPIGIATVAMLLASYRDPPRDHAAGPTGLGGSLLAGVVGAVALLAVEPARDMDTTARSVTAFIGALGIVVLVFQQSRAEVPILPRPVLGSAVVRTGMLGSIFAGAILHACTAYIPLWLATARHLSPIEAGAALVALLVGWAVASSMGVRILVRWGMRVSVGGGFLVAAMGAGALLLTVANDLPVAYCFAALVLLGIGLGPAASTSLIASQSHVPWRFRGMITSALYAIRMLGGALSIAVLASVTGVSGPNAGLRFAFIFGLGVAACVTAFVVAPTSVEEAVGEPT